MGFVCPECAKVEPSPGFCTEHGMPLGDSSGDPMLGQLVGSHRIARLLGRGGMGEVYLGVHPGIGSRVAIKLLALEAALTPGMVERFFAEARAVNVIRHEGIVNVLDLSRLADGRPYITMEYIDGAPLSSVLERHRPVPLGGFVQLMLGVIDALGAAHAQGITHRDLKPDNVFVTSIGRTKILDFGIAKLRPDIAALSGQTRTGALLGTPFYMSPEQARGQPVDHRSDLYAIGVILYEGVTGRRPFEAESLYELLRLQVEIPPERPSALRPEIPPALESVMLRALEKNPALRQQNAAELGSALVEAARFLSPESFVTLAGQPGQASLRLASPSPGGLLPTTPGYANTVSVARPAPKPRSLTPIWIALGAGALVGLLVATGVGTLLVFGDRDTVTVVDTSPPSELAEPASDEEASSDEQPSFTDNSSADPKDFHDQALELAKKSFPDAALSMIVVSAPREDGTIDWESGTMVLTFVSPSAARSAGAAGRCAVWITHTGGAPIATVPPTASCMVASVRPPRCPLSRVVKKLGAHGEDVTLQYGPAASWSVIGEDLFGRTTPDDCGDDMP